MNRQISRLGLCAIHRMLDDLERGVDQTDSKLGDAMRKMRKFIRDTEGLFSLNYVDTTMITC
jgi:hypothetical protein